MLSVLLLVIVLLAVIAGGIYWAISRSSGKSHGEVINRPHDRGEIADEPVKKE